MGVRERNERRIDLSSFFWGGIKALERRAEQTGSNCAAAPPAGRAEISANADTCVGESGPRHIKGVY